VEQRHGRVGTRQHDPRTRRAVQSTTTDARRATPDAAHAAAARCTAFRTGMSEGQQDPAVIHSTEQTRTYPCENCGGQMEFDIASQKLRCPSCGSEREIAGNGETVVVEKDFNAALTELRARAANQAGPQFGAHEIVCQSCGGHTTFDGTLTATRCPYCATPIQRDDVQDAPTRLPVDGILPFSVDEKQARGALEHWVNKRWFAPSEFKKYKRAGSFTSVYGAAFTYDADTTSNYQGRRGDDYTVSVGSGEDQHMCRAPCRTRSTTCSCSPTTGSRPSTCGRWSRGRRRERGRSRRSTSPAT
jgi:DNA-directed RNA polymerase subunit RPC12/RpoP